ncbi:DUF1361 domain-containing protein [Arundinibacter roseus]|uniref:DUF1361 domain-containing protein n=1 Tax=Arundinibacter roseus TaxID=2070510 RepID=A0A4V2XAN7_9BACT|nr:DUF1361 domain-containing protein [Arundinibacter roseus]
MEGLFPLLLLSVLSLLALTFHFIRIQFSEAVDFSLDWNLFLSWIPLLLSFIAQTISKRFGKLPVWIAILSIVWLIFFPNAPYMITDLVHLSVDYGSNLTWHDVIMLFYYAQISLINGLVSLYWFHQTWNRTYSNSTGTVLLLASFPLGGFGVFLGRIQRWNSWDILHNPQNLLPNIIESAFNRTAILLSVEFGLLLGTLYLVLWGLLRFRIRDRFS